MQHVGALLVGGVFALLVAAAPATAQEHKAIGPEKCGKVCHKVEFQSWAASKHATAPKNKAECETCHGNGAYYAKLPIMKDPAKAKALGLIAKPDKASCTKSCHKAAEFKEDMLKKVHAMKKG
jgi:hypothetical protein